MEKRQLGPWIFWGIALLAVPLWWLSFPETTIRHNIKPFFVYGSQVSALVGFALFALCFVLAARIKWLEDYFGGLDRMYHVHHTMAAWALGLILLHPILLATRWIPQDSGRLLWYLFPVHRRFEANLGSWALWGLIVLMFVTLVIHLPYDKWKITHKLLGVPFVLGVTHTFYLDLSYASNPAMKVYLILLSAAGIGAWTYKSILFPLIARKHRCRVVEVNRLSDRVMEIELQPELGALDFVPGQYYFFSFRAANISWEAHPFTVCNTTGEGNLQIMVKSLGDYTTQLHQVLEPGATALLEGPYGRFDYRQGQREQVWIAGGVGIAPFLSWANLLKNTPLLELAVDLYYCVNTASEAVHLPAFTELERLMPNFKVHLLRADVEGFVTAQELAGIEGKDVFICGPKPMRKAVFAELRARKVPKKNIHFEDFDFF